MKSLKKLVLMAVAFAATVPAYAQTAANEQNDGEDVGRRILINKWYENWEVSAKIGTQAYLGEYVLTDFNFGDWWNLPAIDLNISKWGTNCIGLDLGFTFSPMKTLYSNRKGGNDYQYATFAKDGDKVYKDHFNIARGNIGNAYISVIFDLCNIFGGYKKDRFYNLVASVGGGIMFPFGNITYKDVCASFNAGLKNKFNVTEHLSVDLAIRGTLHDDMFNGISYYTSNDRKNLSVDATIGATVGVSYRFDFPGKKVKTASTKATGNNEGWLTVNDIVPQTIAYKAVEQEAKQMQNTVKKMENTISEKDKELADKDAAIESVEKAQAALLKEKACYRQLINFVVDKWNVVNDEKVRVMYAAEVIKRNPNVKYLVEGYADVQTAKPAHNQYLSEQRAKAVYDLLVNEFGVNPKQLETRAHGGVDYMYYNDEQCSRSVIISSVTE